MLRHSENARFGTAPRSGVSLQGAMCMTRCMLRGIQVGNLVGLLASFVSGSVAAESCVDYRSYFTIAATLQPGDVDRVIMAADRAYVPVPSVGLVTYDGTDPANPVEVATVAGICGIDVETVGSSAFMVCGAVYRIDLVSGSITPVIQGASLRSIGIQGNRACGIYNGLFIRDLRVYDTSNPNAWSFMGSLPFSTSDPALGMVAADIHAGRAYLCDAGASGIRIVDVTGAPQQIGSIGTAGRSYYDVVIEDGIAYFATSFGVEIYDLRGPSIIPMPTVPTAAAVRNITVRDGYVLAACGTKGVYLVDIADLASARVVGVLDTPGSAEYAAYDGAGLITVVDEGIGLHFIDATSLRPPTLGTLDTPGFALSVASENGIAITAQGPAGLTFADVTDAQSPLELTTMDTPGEARAIVQRGTYAFVADGDAGLQIIDLRTPTVPMIAGTWDSPGSANGVAVAGGIAYLADQGSGLRIIDVTQPASPISLGAAATSGPAMDVTIDGSIAWVANANGSVQAFDISNPSSPIHRRTIAISGQGLGVATSPGWVFVAAGSAGLVIVDHNLPNGNPTTRTIATGSTARDVMIDGAMIYVADDLGGVHGFDFTNPFNPIRVTTLYDARQSMGIASSGGLLFIADGQWGMRILPAQCASVTPADAAAIDRAGLRLLPRSNPAPGRVLLRLESPFAARRAKLEVFDVSGHRVRSLWSGDLRAGESTHLWDGRDDRGEALPSGVYFAHLNTETSATSARVVLVR